MSKNKFPGFNQCLKMMNKRDSQMCEDGFHWLLPYASDYTLELINAYKSGNYPVISRFWFLELISENLSDDYADFWFEELFKYPEYEHHRDFILGVLADMGRDVRKRAWHLRQTIALETPEKTEAFRNLMDDKFWWRIQTVKKKD